VGKRTLSLNSNDSWSLCTSSSRCSSVADILGKAKVDAEDDLSTVFPDGDSLLMWRAEVDPLRRGTVLFVRDFFFPVLFLSET
jgi:hypothetical protein